MGFKRFSGTMSHDNYEKAEKLSMLLFGEVSWSSLFKLLLNEKIKEVKKERKSPDEFM